MLKFGNRKNPASVLSHTPSLPFSASCPILDIYLCSCGRPEAPHLRHPLPDMAINSLQRVPPVSFAPLGRGATLRLTPPSESPLSRVLLYCAANRSPQNNSPVPLSRLGASSLSCNRIGSYGQLRGGTSDLSLIIGYSGCHTESQACRQGGPGFGPTSGGAQRTRERPGVPRAFATTSGAGARRGVWSRRQPALRGFRRARRRAGPAEGARQRTGAVLAAAAGRRRPRARRPAQVGSTAARPCLVPAPAVHLRSPKRGTPAQRLVRRMSL